MMILRYPSQRFVAGFVASIAFVTSSFLFFNIVVDPYYYFNTPRISNFNAWKPHAAHEMRLMKTHNVYRQQPSNIIFGSSRVELAFDPECPAWNNFPGTTYNMALAGLGIGELYKTFCHAYFASKNFKTAVVGLDFLMFNAHREAVVFSTEVINFREERLLRSNADFYLQKFLYDIDFFFGNKGILASWQTFCQNFVGQEVSYTCYKVNGQAYNYLPAIRGQRLAFSRQEFFYLQKIWRAGPAKQYGFLYNGIDTLETFRHLVAFAYEKKLDLRLFVGPLHGRMLLALKEGGLWGKYEDWKRGIVRVLDEEAKKHNAKPFLLWDFSDFNTISTEPIPGEGDTTNRMKWYYEGSHYSPETGELIVNRVLDYKKEVSSIPADFGVLLTPDNIEEHLATTNIKSRAYKKNFPIEAAFVKQIVREVFEAEKKEK